MPGFGAAFPLGLIVMAVAAGSALALASAGNQAGPTPARGLWVWATPRAGTMVRDQAAWAGFFDFCEAPHGVAAARITEIYLEPPRDCDGETLRAFLAAAHGRGLRAEFLFGDADWQAEHLEGAKRACAEVIEAAAGEGFDGVHLDLENGGRWSQRAFRELLVFLRKRIDARDRKQARPMTLAADLGFAWPPKGADSTPQFGDALKQCDYVVSMAYRDTAGAQVSCAVPEALAAAKRRKRFYIGAETQHLPDQDQVTYFEEGWERLEAELAKLPAGLAEHGGVLSGIAIHHYDSYLDLPREPRASPFRDVRVDHWAFPFIMAAHQAGILSGYGGGAFKPERKVLRAEVAVFLSRALAGRENIPPGPERPSFADVPRDHWAYRSVEYVRACSVVLDEGGAFHPEEVVNRGELAALLARAVARPTGEAGLAGYAPPARPTFPDVRAEGEWAWCHRHVEYLAERGVLSGHPDGRYHPERPCTQDVLAVYGVKAFGLET